VTANTLKVLIGTDINLPAAGTNGGTPTSTPPPATPVQAANGAAGSAGPPMQALSALSGGGIPCVR
jgi:hypothetical protein